MVEGIILTGGYSSRAKQNKMLFLIDGITFIEHAIISMSRFVDKIFVVTGCYHQDIINVVSKYKNVSIILNENYDLGMFSSIQTGVKETTSDFFILPGDCPLVSEEVFMKLAKTHNDISIPVYNNKTGHPIFIKKHLKKEILNCDSSFNLRDFSKRYECEKVEVSDKNILVDIDNLSEYQSFIDERKEL